LLKSSPRVTDLNESANAGTPGRDVKKILKDNMSPFDINDLNFIIYSLHYYAMNLMLKI